MYQSRASPHNTLFRLTTSRDVDSTIFLRSSAESTTRPNPFGCARSSLSVYSVFRIVARRPRLAPLVSAAPSCRPGQAESSDQPIQTTQTIGVRAIRFVAPLAHPRRFPRLRCESRFPHQCASSCPSHEKFGRVISNTQVHRDPVVAADRFGCLL